MPVLRGPSTTGSSLAAFLDAYQRSQQVGRQEETLARQNALVGLQMSEVLRRAQEEKDLSAALANLGTVIPSSAEGGIPALQPSTVTPTGAVAAGLPAEASAEGAALTTQTALAPAVPGTPVTALTPRNLTQQLGSRQAGLILGSQRGRATYEAMGGTTEEKFEQRKRVEQAKARLVQAAHRSMALFESGDTLGAGDAEMAGIRAIMGVADLDHTERMAKRLTELGDRRDKLLKNDKERALADAEAPKIARAVRLIGESQSENDPAKWSQAIEEISGLKSDTQRKEANRIFDNVLSQAKAPEFNPGAVVMKMVSDKLAVQGQGTNYRLTPVQAQREALQAVKQEKPDLFFRAILQLDKAGDVPSLWAEAAFGPGTHVPKNVYGAASSQLLAENLDLSTPAGGKRYEQILLGLIKAEAEAKRRPDTVSDTQNKISRRMIYDRELKLYTDALKDYEKAKKPPSGLALPTTPAELTEMEARLRALWENARKARQGLLQGKDVELGELPPPPAGTSPKGRAATRQEYDAAKATARRDLERFRSLLRAKGIDPTLPPGP